MWLQAGGGMRVEWRCVWRQASGGLRVEVAVWQMCDGRRVVAVSVLRPDVADCGLSMSGIN